MCMFLCVNFIIQTDDEYGDNHPFFHFEDPRQCREERRSPYDEIDLFHDQLQRLLKLRELELQLSYF